MESETTTVKTAAEDHKEQIQAFLKAKSGLKDEKKARNKRAKKARRINR